MISIPKLRWVYYYNYERLMISFVVSGIIWAILATCIGRVYYFDKVMTINEAMCVAFISAAIPAIVSLLAVLVATIQNHRKDEKTALFRYKIELRSELKDDLSSFTSKAQMCYYNMLLGATKPKNINAGMFAENASMAVKFSDDIKMNLDEKDDKLLIDKINEINDICKYFDITRANEIKLRVDELFTLARLKLRSLDKEILRLSK